MAYRKVPVLSIRFLLPIFWFMLVGFWDMDYLPPTKFEVSDAQVLLFCSLLNAQLFFFF